MNDHIRNAEAALHTANTMLFEAIATAYPIGTTVSYPKGRGTAKGKITGYRNDLVVVQPATGGNTYGVSYRNLTVCAD